jgi:transcriptional antiterminator NusG
MTSPTYLIYAHTGREFDVARDLACIGIDAWCGRRIEWKRVGKDRRPRATELPVLPNYIFATMDAEQFHQARQVKHLAPTMAMLSRASVRGYESFRKVVETQYRLADQKRRCSEVVVEPFMAGQVLDIIGGPFADLCGKFRRVVQAAHDVHPKIEMDMGGITVQVDPLDVRRSG